MCVSFRPFVRRVFFFSSLLFMGRLWLIFCSFHSHISNSRSRSLYLSSWFLIFSNVSNLFKHFVESVSRSLFAAVICKKNSVFRHLNLDEVRLSFLSIYSLGVFGSRRSFGLVRIFFCLLVSLKMISISLSFHSIYHTM